MSSTVEEMQPAEIKARLDERSPDLVLLDCREPEEIAIARIDGALHIPMGDIPSRLQSLDPSKEYVVFCHHGVRSAHVVSFLRKQEFERVHNMTGGIDAWSRDVDPTVPRYD
jgi:rhodanese-related sulfurtransferase